MSPSILSLALTAICMTSLWSSVQSHGRLWSPPGRATMWRRGFNTPKNYDDNQLFCGGLSHQQSLGYKCGICGDPYDSNRPHEAGGKYATGTIAATYVQGQEVVLEVDLTANHKGWFEFKICPTNDFTQKATQGCLDLYPLQMSDGSGTKLDVTHLGSSMISMPVMLPGDLTCDLCVLQWHYHGGNNWSNDYTGQEEFYGCADVKIEPSVVKLDGNANNNNNKKPNPSGAKVITATTTTRPHEPTTLIKIINNNNNNKVQTQKPPVPANNNKKSHCVPTQTYAHAANMAEWCDANCKNNFCPATHCKCD